MRLTLAFFFLIQLSGSAFCFQRVATQNYFNLGKAAFENKKWKESQDYLDQWLQTHPADQEAYWIRGQAFQNQGNLDRALSDFSSLLILNPIHAEAHFERGRVRYQLKQYEEAMVDFENFLKTPPGETTRILFKISPGDNAVSGITTAQTSSQEDAYYHLGLCSIALEEYDFALLYLDEAILLNPKQADFHAEKGRALARLGDNVPAIESYETALQLGPDHLPAKQGLALVKTGGDTVLLEQLDQVISDSAGNSQTYKQRGFYRMNHDDYAGAIEDFTIAITMDPDDSESFFYRGMIRSRQKSWAKAEEDYSEAVDLEPENPEYFLARGQARYVSQRLEAALADFTVTVSLDPEHASGYYHRGITHQRMGKLKDACADLLKAKELGMEAAEIAWQKVCN
ncbi:Tfp pilus assembly protein PilF [Algoriphagus alkaliphilus]|uniref:Tfp pilus assembly protein PilF n=1 Tax=Algoriphagus alkaliphilus TaxID=279824 RepID=A0A1G5UVK7_9BACT|nr:tetratricopeptide repeat protein [Algoriphagus alkaliphilus]SDA37338.1 Tfp pilus assembly protein PilF [Algoriphagus alkaliphilus]